MYSRTYIDQRTTHRDRFFSSATWILGIEGLVTSDCPLSRLGKPTRGGHPLGLGFCKIAFQLCC